MRRENRGTGSFVLCRYGSCYSNYRNIDEADMKKEPCKCECEILEEDSKSENVICAIGCLIVAAIMVAIAWFVF